MQILNITQSLYQDYASGKITIDEVAEELYLSGHTNFVDIKHAKSQMRNESRKPLVYESTKISAFITEWQKRNQYRGTKFLRHYNGKFKREFECFLRSFINDEKTIKSYLAI